MLTEVEKETEDIKNKIEHFGRLSRADKMRPLASELITKYPEDYYGYYAMALCEYNDKKYDECIELCNKSMDLGMDRSEGLFLVMNCCYLKEDRSAMDEIFNTLSTSYPENYKARALYGEFLFKTGEMSKGATLLKEAFSKDPTNDFIIKLLFVTTSKIQSSRLEELMKIYMDSGASDADKLWLTGLYEYKLRNYRKAKKLFKKVLAIDPTHNNALKCMDILHRRNTMLVMMVGVIVYTYIVSINFDIHRPWMSILYIPSIFVGLFIIRVLRWLEY